MSKFSNLMHKILGSSAAAATPAPGAAPAAPPPAAGAPPAAAPPMGGKPTSSEGAMSAGKTSGGTVDVGAVLDKAVADKGQKLNWRTSIVDLMKAVDLDSSLASRKELAQDLHYDGDMEDSAAMNVWLHKQVMKKLAEGGGKVPSDLHG